MKRLKPDTDATGDHTTFAENGSGFITKYATWLKNLLNPSGFELHKRFDMFGKRHYNKKTQMFVETPHVHTKEAVGGVRKANNNEIPKRNQR